MPAPSRFLPWTVLPIVAVLAIGQHALLWAPLSRQGLEGPTVANAVANMARLAAILLGAALVRVMVATVRRRVAGVSLRPRSADVIACLWDAIWILTIVSVVATTYTWCKLFLPAFGGELWDGRLADADLTYHLGVNPNVVLVTIFANGPRWAAEAMDAYYCAFVTTMIAGAAWFLADLDRARRVAFTVGFVVLWSVGLWWYVAMPALGPAFVFPEIAREVESVFPAVASTQALLGENYRRVLLVLESPGRSILVAPQYGVAAMPSLHVAAHALLFLWALLVGSRLRAVLLAMTVLTFLGSVATGWHYAVDSWAGLVLAALSLLPAWSVREALRRNAATTSLRATIALS